MTKIYAQEGFSTLFVVIILGSISLGLAIFMSTSSLWSVRESSDFERSGQAKALSNACAEIALENIRENTDFVGSGSTIINGNTCNYSVTNTGGDNRTIAVSGAVGVIIRKLQINISSFNPIVISSWQEVP